jgi:hypothetical protein
MQCALRSHRATRRSALTVLIGCFRHAEPHVLAAAGRVCPRARSPATYSRSTATGPRGSHDGVSLVYGIYGSKMLLNGRAHEGGSWGHELPSSLELPSYNSCVTHNTLDNK